MSITSATAHNASSIVARMLTIKMVSLNVLVGQSPTCLARSFFTPLLIGPMEPTVLFGLWPSPIRFIYTTIPPTCMVFVQRICLQGKWSLAIAYKIFIHGVARFLFLIPSCNLARNFHAGSRALAKGSSWDSAQFIQVRSRWCLILPQEVLLRNSMSFSTTNFQLCPHLIGSKTRQRFGMIFAWKTLLHPC